MIQSICTPQKIKPTNNIYYILYGTLVVIIVYAGFHAWNYVSYSSLRSTFTDNACDDSMQKTKKLKKTISKT